MKPLSIQHAQAPVSRYRRLTMGYICPSKCAAVLWCKECKEPTGIVPVQFNHDQLSNDEAGMT